MTNNANVLIVIFPTMKVEDEELIWEPYDELSDILKTTDNHQLASDALYGLTNQEKHTMNVLTNKNYPEMEEDDEAVPGVLHGREIPKLTERMEENVSQLFELFYRDERVFESHYDNTEVSAETCEPYAVVIFQDGYYRGHIYCWDMQIDDNSVVMNIMGIRSSIYHILFRDKTHISLTKYLFKAIKDFVESRNSNETCYLRITHPIDVMTDISRNMGFRDSVEVVEEYPDLDWLLSPDPDISLVCKGSVLDEDEFEYREGDMIIDTKDLIIKGINFTLDIIE